MPVPNKISMTIKIQRAIKDIDTRALVRHIRDAGAMNAIISTEIHDVEGLKEELKKIDSEMTRLKKEAKVLFLTLSLIVDWMLYFVGWSMLFFSNWKS